MYDDAVQYFETEVLFNDPWTTAENAKQLRALKNAENLLYSTFSMYNRDKKPLPQNAIFEQALWLLRQDDTTLKAELGYTSISLSGEINVSVNSNVPKIAPNVTAIIRKSRGKVGRYR